MRGALTIPPHYALFVRIIPADAGSTHGPLIKRDSEEDHPRGCGEHAEVSHLDDLDPGSSPRMRGAPFDPWLPHPESGIIPADAGSTVRQPMLRILHEDHPRGCGEHPEGEGYKCRMKGSSPRMRGAPLYKLPTAHGERIIPADAGSTQSMASSLTGSGDHPRGCGEHHQHQGL